MQLCSCPNGPRNTISLDVAWNKKNIRKRCARPPREGQPITMTTFAFTIFPNFFKSMISAPQAEKNKPSYFGRGGLLHQEVEKVVRYLTSFSIRGSPFTRRSRRLYCTWHHPLPEVPPSPGGQGCSCPLPHSGWGCRPESHRRPKDDDNIVKHAFWNLFFYKKHGESSFLRWQRVQPLDMKFSIFSFFLESDNSYIYLYIFLNFSV